MNEESVRNFRRKGFEFLVQESQDPVRIHHHLVLSTPAVMFLGENAYGTPEGKHRLICLLLTCQDQCLQMPHKQIGFLFAMLFLGPAAW